MLADIHTRFESDFYRIRDFLCRCTDNGTSPTEYSTAFSISFVRKGNFLFNVFRNSLDSYTGCVLITKPGYERTVTHVHDVPDECTIFEFRSAAYDEIRDQFGWLKFFSDNDSHALLVRTHPDIEFIHHAVVSLIRAGKPDKLMMDSLVTELVTVVLHHITDDVPDIDVYDRLKRNHLTTVERAKAYIADYFREDISLSDIAQHCHVSLFHFTRLFRKLTGWAPYQFLRRLRLKHAELLLKTSALPVSAIAYASGFNSTEHFSSAFRESFGVSPVHHRNREGFPIPIEQESASRWEPPRLILG